jgi:hypothetical protein
MRRARSLRDHLKDRARHLATKLRHELEQRHAEVPWNPEFDAEVLDGREAFYDKLRRTIRRLRTARAHLAELDALRGAA